MSMLVIWVFHWVERRHNEYLKPISN